MPSRRALVDSSAYFALTDPRDIRHGYSLQARERLINERWNVLTTNFLLAETHALLLTRLGRDTAARVLREIDRSATTVIRITRDDELRARQIIDEYVDKDFSLVDATSFAVMERLSVSFAFAFDRHFVQFGFQLLNPL
ncbi:MAG: PIN domain-containing protein [Dehalococcoidia bacterium]|nr:PIN domain-containing protein [Dehalococcoidia bacterium]